MSVQLDEAMAVLERTPGTLRAILDGLPDFWTRSNYGESTFSPFDVVGHLIEGERHNWMVRARMILGEGTTRPFPAFDRYAMYKASQGKSMAILLADFATLRATNLIELRGLNLTPEQLSLRGLHPDLGPVTLGNLLAAWTVHDLGHTHQIAKAMAFQYREAVGPWVKFLTILPRE